MHCVLQYYKLLGLAQAEEAVKQGWWSQAQAAAVCSHEDFVWRCLLDAARSQTREPQGIVPRGDGRPW